MTVSIVISNNSRISVFLVITFYPKFIPVFFFFKNQKTVTCILQNTSLQWNVWPSWIPTNTSLFPNSFYCKPHKHGYHQKHYKQHFHSYTDLLRRLTVAESSSSSLGLDIDGWATAITSGRLSSVPGVCRDRSYFTLAWGVLLPWKV